MQAEKACDTQRQSFYLDLQNNFDSGGRFEKIDLKTSKALLNLRKVKVKWRATSYSVHASASETSFLES